MSQQRVIYLPPGVVPPPGPPQQGPGPAVAPFDRPFFEKILPQAVGNFAGEVSCKSPIVQVTTVDGTTHYVRGISGVSDNWVALHVTHHEQEEPAQVFVPYQTIFRVEIDPCSDARPRRLGFALSETPALVPPSLEEVQG